MRSTTLCFSIFITMICILASCEAVKKKKHGKKNPDSVYWKNDYEEELSKAAISNEKDEKSHNFAKSNSEDTLMEKIVDSLSSSEEFLKKINSIEIKLTRLDAELHERTDDIRKQLAQVLKKFNEMPDLKNLETALDHFQSNKVKANENYEASDTNVDVRLNGIERSLQSIASMVSVNKKHQFGIHNKLDNCGDTEVMSLMRQFQRNMFINKGNCDCKDSRVDRSESFPADCNEIQMQGFNISGIYKIKPEESHAFYVLCDLSSPGGGWTVLQNRFDGTQDFYKPWSDYQNGFGNLAGEFWLGLDKIHQLTTQKLYSLRIELESAQGIESFASYSVFSVGPEIEGFRISALGNYYGNAGDSLSYHAGQRFSTWDSDNDDWKDGSCAQKHGGAWWYKECAKSNLNGYYTNNEGDTTQMASMFWTPIDRSGYLTKVKIMIRPLPATHPKTHSYYSNSQKSKLTRPHHPGTSHMHYRDENLSSNNFFN